MALAQNPYDSPVESDPSKASLLVAPIVCMVTGAILGGLSFAQTLSTFAFFVDHFATLGLWFLLSGSAIGLLVGTPIGAIAGWRIGKGRMPDFRFVGIGAVVFCLVFSLPILVTGDSPVFLMIVTPLFGLFSGAVVGATASVLFPSSHSG